MRQVNFFFEETRGALFVCHAHRNSDCSLTDFDDTKLMTLYTLSTLKRQYSANQSQSI